MKSKFYIILLSLFVGCFAANAEDVLSCGVGYVLVDTNEKIE